MSAQHAPHDDDAGRDPHDIIPDEFYAAWPGDTVSEKLRAAEQAPSTTDPHTLPRCPADGCSSTRLVPKADKFDSEQRADGAYQCAACGHHFDDPDPSIEAEWREQVKEMKAKSLAERHADRPPMPETDGQAELSEVDDD